MLIEGKNVIFRKEDVLKAIDCFEDSPVYAEVTELYDELTTELTGMASPKGLLGIEEIPSSMVSEEYPAGTRTAMLLYTIGDKISSYSTQMFSEGDYLKAMLINAMADSCLFETEQEWKPVLLDLCRKQHMGIAKRLEAPQDLPMDIHKVVYRKLRGEQIGLRISGGFMFYPTKTLCQIFILTEDACIKNVEHDCGRCTNVTCKFRKTI